MRCGATQGDGDVAPDPDRRQARRDSRRLAAARSARRAIQVPRIICPPRKQVVGFGGVGKFGKVRLRKQDAARLLHARHEQRARAIFAAVAGAQLMARSRSDISLFDSLIESYRVAGLLPE